MDINIDRSVVQSKYLPQFQFCKDTFTFLWHLICRNEAFQLIISYKIDLKITPLYGLQVETTVSE